MPERNLTVKTTTDIKEWFDKISDGSVIEIDALELDRSLSRFGAKVELNNSDLDSLKKYKLDEAFDGLRATWGDSRMDKFDVFLANFILEYNSVDGHRRLPRSKDSHSGEMGLGMRRFFLEFTQFGFGLLDFDTFAERTKAAVKNGELWQQKKDKDRISLPNPKSGDRSERVLVLAPGFLPKFYDWLLESSK